MASCKTQHSSSLAIDAGAFVAFEDEDGWGTGIVVAKQRNGTLLRVQPCVEVDGVYEPHCEEPLDTWIENCRLMSGRFEAKNKFRMSETWDKQVAAQDEAAYKAQQLKSTSYRGVEKASDPNKDLMNATAAGYVKAILHLLGDETTAMVLDSVGAHTTKALLNVGVTNVIVPNPTTDFYEVVEARKDYKHEWTWPISLLKALHRVEPGSLAAVIADYCCSWNKDSQTDVLAMFGRRVFAKVGILLLTLCMRSSANRVNTAGDMLEFVQSAGLAQGYDVRLAHMHGYEMMQYFVFSVRDISME